MVVDRSSRSRKYSFTGSIKLSIEDKELTYSLYNALKPETKDPPNPKRTSISIAIDECSECSSRYNIVISIKAHDLASLRASINSYIYLIYASLKSLRTIKTAPDNKAK